MSYRTAIYDMLNDVSANVFPLVAPQETDTTYAVYSTRLERVLSQDGVFVKTVYLTVNIYANDFSNCDQFANYIRIGVDGKKATYGTDSIDGGLLLSESDDYIPGLDKYIITQEYQIYFV